MTEAMSSASSSERTATSFGKALPRRDRARPRLEGSQQRTESVALAHLLDAAGLEPGAIQQIVPALLLCHAGERLVLSSEDGEVLQVTLCSFQGLVG